MTTTSPLVAPAGTGTRMLDADQDDGVAAIPLNVTVPCEVPKLLPLIVTAVAAGPLPGDRLVIVGGAGAAAAPAAALNATATAE